MRAPLDFAGMVMAEVPALRRYALGLVRNSAQAEDLVQDTIERALRNERGFTIGTNLGAWLTTILRNKMISDLRRRRREVEDPDEAVAKSVPFIDDPCRRMEARELLALIDRLPEDMRAPLRMIADGATYEEISAELGIPEGTVKSRISRARYLIEGAA